MCAAAVAVVGRRQEHAVGNRALGKERPPASAFKSSGAPLGRYCQLAVADYQHLAQMWREEDIAAALDAAELADHAGRLGVARGS